MLVRVICCSTFIAASACFVAEKWCDYTIAHGSGPPMVGLGLVTKFFNFGGFRWSSGQQCVKSLI